MVRRSSGAGRTRNARRPRCPRAARELRRGPHLRQLLAQPAVMQPKGEAFTIGHRETTRGRPRAELQLDRSGEHRDVGATSPGDPAIDPAQERMDEAVFGAGHVLDLQLDPTTHPLELADEQAGGTSAEVVAPLVRPHRQCVDQGGGSRRRGEGGLENHGPVEVAALGLELAHRADGPVAGRVVEETSEDRGAVEGRKAQPFDRTLPVDQRCRVAIGEQRVVSDRRGAHDPSSPRNARGARSDSTLPKAHCARAFARRASP